VNPSGKLPISWERRLEDSPAYGNFIETADSKDVHYTEGIFLGYRQFDRGAVKPLFPLDSASPTPPSPSAISLSRQHGLRRWPITVAST